MNIRLRVILANSLKNEIIDNDEKAVKEIEETIRKEEKRDD